MNSKQRFRARIVLIGVILAATVLASALYMRQIIDGPAFSAKAQAQYVKPATTLFDRGTIFFTSKDGTKVAAAAVSSGDLVYMNPSALTDSSGAYDALSRYISIPRSNFMTDAAKSNDHYEELADKVDDTTAQSIRAAGFPGIGIMPENWRSYPGGKLAAHILGLVGENADTSLVAGRYGLESRYDPILERPDMANNASALAGLFSGLRNAILGGGTAAVGDIETSIEPTVQGYLEKVLASTTAEWHPDEIGGVIMDPKTGEIVGMASLPAFDPNDTSAIKNAKIFSNPMVEHVYEMGSIMKPLTMAMALDSGSVPIGFTYNDTGCMTLDTKKICNYDGKARGVTDLQTILSQSLNMGAATIAMRAGAANLLHYFSAYGLATTTGIDLPNEAFPIVGNLKKPKDIDIATASYGQGIAISPVGMARALSVLANGGYVVTPHVVDKIDYEDGTTKTLDWPRTGPVLQSQTVDDVDTMLTTVVDTALAKGAIKMDRYTMAAKTGTAEIPDPRNGGYYTDRYLHSFFGFFPAHEARFIVFLYQVYPKGAQYASETLTQPYNDLAKFLISYYNIPPDR